MLNILILEDSTADAALLECNLRRRWPDARLTCADSREALCRALDQGPWDVVIADYTLADFTGLEALSLVRDRDADLPFVIVSGTIGEEAAVEAMRAGAQDYVMKDHLARLVPALERELREADMRRGHRRAAEALAQSQERQRAAFDQAPVGIAEAEVDGRIVRVNPRFAQMLGYPPEALVGRTFQELTHPADLPANLGYLRRALAGELRDYTLEKRYVRSDGRIVWGNLRAVLLRGEGDDPDRLLGMVEDITDRKRAEERLRVHGGRLRALASRLVLTENAERRRIATGLHDSVVQTLLFAKLRLQAVRRGALAADVAENLAEALTSIEQALRDTRDLIFHLCPPMLHSGGLGATLAWLADRTRKDHGLAVQVSRETDDPPLTDGVRVTLYRGVRELLANVTRHARATEATVRLGREAGAVRVEVADNGVGFDPAPLETLTGASGGFGLFDLRERLQDLGGRLEVRSAPGRGTHVVLWAPLAPGTAPQGRPK